MQEPHPTRFDAQHSNFSGVLMKTMIFHHRLRGDEEATFPSCRHGVANGVVTKLIDGCRCCGDGVATSGVEMRNCDGEDGVSVMRWIEAGGTMTMKLTMKMSVGLS